MIHVSVEDAVKNLRREFVDLTNEEFNRGTSRAINHTLSKVKTASSKEIRQIYNILARDLNKAFTIRKAFHRELTGYVIVQGKPLSIDNFEPQKSGRGISVEIKKGQRVQINKAFFATMPNSKYGVFARGQYQGKGFEFRRGRIKPAGGYKKVNGRFQPVNNDLNINSLTTISAPIAFANRVGVDIMKRKIDEEFPTRLVHELRRLRG